VFNAPWIGGQTVVISFKNMAACSLKVDTIQVSNIVGNGSVSYFMPNATKSSVVTCGTVSQTV
jgi:hypothetical protein